MMRCPSVIRSKQEGGLGTLLEPDKVRKELAEVPG